MIAVLFFYKKKEEKVEPTILCFSGTFFVVQGLEQSLVLVRQALCNLSHTFSTPWFSDKLLELLTQSHLL
jgi:hypothetical protein